MPFIQWNETLSVHVKEIDSQHKKLVQLLNNLHDANEKEISFNDQLKIIEELMNYANIHFQTEEKYMKKFNYPALNFHKSQHDFFIKKIIDFHNRLIETKENIFNEILGFLKSWLINHILTIDKKYSRHFIENGLS